MSGTWCWSQSRTCGARCVELQSRLWRSSSFMLVRVWSLMWTVLSRSCYRSQQTPTNSSGIVISSVHKGGEHVFQGHFVVTLTLKRKLINWVSHKTTPCHWNIWDTWLYNLFKSLRSDSKKALDVMAENFSVLKVISLVITGFSAQKNVVIRSNIADIVDSVITR